MAISKPKLMTSDEFERFISLPDNNDRRWELIDGEVVEKMPTQLHGVIAGLIATFLNMFLMKNKLGHVAVEARHKLPNEKRNNRLPDVAFISNDKGPLVRKGPAPYMPDLAVEIKSPDDDWNGMVSKAAYYLENGSRLVWLVHAEDRTVTVITTTSKTTLNEDDTLTGGDVLPGFAVPVKDIFPE